MSKVQLVGVLAIAGVCAAAVAIAMADPVKSSPTQAAPPSVQAPAPGKSSEKSAGPEFPAIVQKKMHAKNDFRGKQAPKFEVEKWLSTEPKREGKVVLVDFWATWCPPCRALIPELNEFQAKFKDDLVVIGVSDEKSETVSSFAKKTKMEYSSAIDTQSRMKNALAVEGIPHVMIIDSTGVVRWQGFPNGDEKLTEKIVKQIIDADKAQQAAAKKKS
jgi:cytochrome c biogenesis protein CcmG, thiol:disulfide interchange protein DsbE